MATLKILIFPDPKLRTVAEPVKEVDDSIVKLSKDMLETMYDGDGIGLAATQVDVHKRVIVVDVSNEKNDPLILINPTIHKIINNFIYFWINQYKRVIFLVTNIYNNNSFMNINLSGCQPDTFPFIHSL